MKAQNARLLILVCSCLLFEIQEDKIRAVFPYIKSGFPRCPTTCPCKIIALGNGQDKTHSVLLCSTKKSQRTLADTTTNFSPVSIFRTILHTPPLCGEEERFLYDYSIILSSSTKPVQGSNAHKLYYICPPNYLLTHTLCKVINF